MTDFENLTSEEKLGILEPPDYQCKHIDDMIERAKQGLMFTRDAVFAVDPQTIIQANKEAHIQFFEFPDELEEMRTVIEEVRLWGNGWKKLAKELIYKHEPERLKEKIDESIPF